MTIHCHKETIKLSQKTFEFRGQRRAVYGGIFNSLPLTCFSWGEAGGERGAWFVSILTQNDKHGRLGIRKRKRERKHCSPSQRERREKKTRNNGVYARARAHAERSSIKLERRVMRVNVRASRGAMRLSQVGAPGYGTRRCVCACAITRRARARPIASRGSPPAGQSAPPGQPATAWSRACCSRAPGLARTVIVTSARVANTVDTSWRHGAPRERHASSPSAPRNCNVVHADFALSRHSSLSLFVRVPWTA